MCICHVRLTFEFSHCTFMAVYCTVLKAKELFVPLSLVSIS